MTKAKTKTSCATWEEADRLLGRLREVTDRIEAVRAETTVQVERLQERARRRIEPMRADREAIEAALAAFAAERLPDEKGRSTVLLPNGKVWVKRMTVLERLPGKTDEDVLEACERHLPDAVVIKHRVDWSALKRRAAAGEVAKGLLRRLGVALKTVKKPGWQMSRVPREVPRS